MKRALALLLICAASTGAAAAQMLDSDSRVATIPYSAGNVIPLRTAAGNSLSIIFAPGERIEGVEVGDPEAVDVALSGSTDSLFVRTLRTPTNPALTVRTNLRRYSFSVQVGPANAAAYTVRFTYGPEAPAALTAPATASAMTGSYKLSGTRVLRPSRISDDGVHTYLEWSEEQALPAVFALNSLGEEEMVDGYMREGIFTIDRVNPVLVFRIGKKTAKAERLR